MTLRLSVIMASRTIRRRSARRSGRGRAAALVALFGLAALLSIAPEGASAAGGGGEGGGHYDDGHLSR